VSKANRWQGRIYLGRDEDGKQQFHWVGRFRTRKERDEEVARERVRIETEGCDCDGCTAMGNGRLRSAGLPTIEHQVARYLADYKRRNRDSSHDTQQSNLSAFRRDFGDRTIDLPRPELKDWIAGEGDWEKRKPAPMGQVWAIVSFFNWSIDEDEVDLPKSPARGLGGRIKGRSEDAPPTEAEFELLVESCDALGDFGPRMRATFLFAAFELARPSEVVEIKESDIDFKTNRIGKRRRLYRGKVAEPKTGPKVIALTSPAREAIAPFLPGDGGHIFLNKSGTQLTTGTLSEYWRIVLVRAGLDFDFYHATKHYGVWFMWVKMGLSNRAIAALAGWKLRTVDKMLETYGHGEIGALDEVDAAFENFQGPNGLRVIEGGKQ
jgi:integrase